MLGPRGTDSVASKRSERLGASVAAGLLISFASRPALADDLSALLYLIFVWPVGAVIGLALVVLLVVAMVKLARGRRGPGPARYGAWTALSGAAGGVLFALFTLAMEWHFADFRHLDVALVHIGVMGLLAAACIVVGLLLRARSR